MARYTNTHIVQGSITRILVTKDSDTSYLKEVLVDTDKVHLLGKISVSKSTGYALTVAQMSVAHLVLGHLSNRQNVVDHINGNRLDNRVENLRILSLADNANNRRNTNNNTGIVGIAKRSNGNYLYYRITVSDRTHSIISGTTVSACKKYTKQFNINKLGDENALTLAKKWLEAKRVEFGYV